MAFPASPYPGGVLAEPAGMPPVTIEQTYETPNGFIDFPFIYIYDGRLLTNGNNYYNKRVPMDGTADFILRAIFGFGTVLSSPAPPNFGKFQLRNWWGSYASSAPMIVNAGGNGVISPSVPVGSPVPGMVPSLRNPDVWQVVPERRYPYDGQIGFDLLNVQTGVYAAQNQSVLGFMGVKRRPASNYCAYETPYKYKELPFAYVQEITVSATAEDANGNINPPTIYQQNVTDYDFELQRILVVTTNTALGITVACFSLVLYDPAGEPMMSAPVPFHWLTDNGEGAGGSGSQGPINPSGLVFPCPPIVYPNQSRIRFDVWSNIPTSFGPYTAEIVYQGVQRMPCT